MRPLPTTLLIGLPLAVVAALLFSEWRRPGDPVDGEAALPAGDPLAEERARLERERTALEEEREALRRQREEELAQRELETEWREESVELREEEVLARDGDLASRERELLEWEQQLSERELEAAGTTVLEDWTEPEPVAYREPVADYDLFYDGLGDHGSWFDTPDYGYVYQPTIVIQDASWRPYTRGRWICTNLGWTWYSDEPFGWACYHYGRWALLGGRGWCWVPGREWAPSWVAWRHGGGYVGWAPLPPETLCRQGRGWSSSVEAEFGIGDRWYCFVDRRHIADPLWRHCLPSGRNRDLLRQTRACTNIHYRGGRVVCGGPSYADLRQGVGRAWPVRRLEFDPLGGLGRGPGIERARLGRIERDVLRVFAPNLDSEGSRGLRPSRLAGRWDRLEVDRAPGGIGAEWARRYRETRERPRDPAAARDAGELRAAEERADRLRRNREAASEVREGYLAKLEARGTALRQRPSNPRAPARIAPEPPETTAVVRPAREPSRPGLRLPGGMVPAEGDRDSVVEQIRRQADPRAVESPPPTAREGSLAGRLAEARQRLGNPRARTVPSPGLEPGGDDAIPAPQDRGRETVDRRRGPAIPVPSAAERARQQQELARERARQASDQRARDAAQAQRQASERAREQQARLRESQERMRQQQEAARQAAEQRARAQQEANRRATEQRARAQQEAARRAAEERARAQQEASRRAAAERAQQEASRRAAAERAQAQQEANRRAAAERAQAQQEAARRAAEERSRQQQERLREAQERSRGGGRLGR